MKKFRIFLAASLLLTGCQTQLIPMPTNPHAKATFLGTEGNLPFSEAVKVGNALYLSGQIGLKDGKLVPGGVKTETKQIFININNTLNKYGYQKSDLVKCMVMLKDMNDFGTFNKVYQTELQKPYPARSAFGVSDLALGSNVEVECMAVK